MFQNILLFTSDGSGLKLRKYQEKVALAVVDSVLNHKGYTFVVIFPRQSGKNELQAQIETYLLSIYSSLGAEIVKVSPTWKPQSLNAMRRLERVLQRNLVSRGIEWAKEQGYIYRVDIARIFFLSGSPTSNVVGATASTLLECDEAQDVEISKWDKEINPMAASTNATKVFWGTAWTSTTLLAREKRAALKAQEQDGIQRVFEIDADQVGAEVKAYKKFVQAEILKLGRNHPFVITQYFSKEIDSQGGMFPPARLKVMQGSHSPQASPVPGHLYAFLIDIAGEDEASTESGEEILKNAGRDSTALTIVEIDLSTLEDDLIKAPTYRTVNRHLWTGAKHTNLYGSIKALADDWQPVKIVIDATGVGAGLCSFLDKALPGKIIPFIFTQKSKSDLGWGFLAVIESGRYKEHSPSPYQGEGRGEGALQAQFWNQCSFTQSEILPGPNRTMRWSVPDGTRDTATNELVHDDLVISAALCSILDSEQFGTAISEVIQAYDPLSELTF